MTDDRGAAGVIVVFLAAMGLLMLSGAGVMIEVVETRARMSAAADLGALAAARDGDCEQGLKVAMANSAQDAECAVDGDDVAVVAASTIRMFGASLTVSAQARAGPP